MDLFDISAYGDSIAEFYDEHHEGVDLGLDATLEVLMDLGGAGPSLELGIGTGRVALPLAERGMKVEGIDASTKMLDQLRSKPGSEGIAIRQGNFRDVTGGPYRLIFSVFNTLNFLLTQDDQLQCFCSVAENLEEGGFFVIETSVPNPRRFSAGSAQFVEGQYVEAQFIEEKSVVLDTMKIDPHKQLLTAAEVVLSEEGVKVYPVQMRYAWPSELDLMARVAGMRLCDRWAGWRKERLTFSSATFVSVFQKSLGTA